MNFVKDKKGLTTPVIATIVLVGLIIVVGVVLYFWMSGVEEEEVEGKSGAVLAGRLRCKDEVDISVTCAGGSVNVNNVGGSSITAFRIKDVSGIRTMENEILPGTSKTIGSRSGSVEVMPVILEQGVPITCSEKGKTAEC